MLLGIVGWYWDVVGCCWMLECCWVVLDVVECCWMLLCVGMLLDVVGAVGGSATVLLFKCHLL